MAISNALIQRRKRKRKAKAKRLLPPPIKASRRIFAVDKNFVWEDLEKALRRNSARGPERAEYQTKIQRVSGVDLRKRIHALGFAVTDFARRHGMSPSSFYEMTHYPAGALMTKYIRLVEFEEFLLAVAEIIETDGLGAEDMRARLEAILDAQIARI